MPALQKTGKMFTKTLYWQKLERWLYFLLLARYVRYSERGVPVCGKVRTNNTL